MKKLVVLFVLFILVVITMSSCLSGRYMEAFDNNCRSNNFHAGSGYSAPGASNYNPGCYQGYGSWNSSGRPAYSTTYRGRR
ncbi:MAG: hypothetical protein WCI91_03670 [Candidatus Nomurabacteria bacterium]